MSDVNNYYVLCKNNCKFEGMTKEQILAAIEQAVSNGEIKDVDTGFVTKIKERNMGAALSFWVGTQAQYNALETKAENCFYIITDDTTFEDFQTQVKTINENFINQQTQIVKNQNNIYDLEDRCTELENRLYKKTFTTSQLDFSEYQEHTLDGIKDYSLFIINGVLCARNGGEITGCSSAYENLGTESTTIHTIQLYIDNNTLSGDEENGVEVKTIIDKATGKSQIVKNMIIDTIVGIC